MPGVENEADWFSPKGLGPVSRRCERLEPDWNATGDWFMKLVAVAPFSGTEARPLGLSVDEEEEEVEVVLSTSSGSFHKISAPRTSSALMGEA